jgi:hypothetical protein
MVIRAADNEPFTGIPADNVTTRQIAVSALDVTDMICLG